MSFQFIPHERLAALSAAISGLLGFTLTEALTSQWGLAALSTALASIGGAVLVTIPKIITARSGSRAAASSARETETTNLIDRMTAFHGNEIQFYQRRIAEKELIITLERKSKHRMLSESQRLVFHINFLENMVREKGGSPPHFNVTPYEELVGEADRQIEEMVSIRATEQAAPYASPGK